MRRCDRSREFATSGRAGLAWFETHGFAVLLTMRVWRGAACRDLVLRSALARVSKDGHAKEDNTTSRSRDAWRPSFSFNPPSSETEGAGKTGCPSHPWSACSKKKHAAEPQVRAEQPAFPAQWCYGLYVLSPVTRLRCHRRRSIIAEQLDASLGAPGPHDFAVRVVLLVRQHAASIASRCQRP
jgi:hypothetical protein